MKNTDKKDSKLIVGDLKEKIKDLIRKHMKETSTSAGAGSYMTPAAFGKVKNPTAGLPGSKVVGSIDEKKKSKEEEPEKKGHDEPMIKPTKRKKNPLLDPEVRIKKLEKIKNALQNAETELDLLYRTRKQSLKK